MGTATQADGHRSKQKVSEKDCEKEMDYKEKLNKN